MKSSEVKFWKGLVHLGLAAVPIAEMKNASTKLRTALLGIAAGWHLNAAFYHFFIEEKPKRKRS
jgi:formate/nitrite transporter FocA (FNT family)